jgi:hypothetical protein
MQRPIVQTIGTHYGHRAVGYTILRWDHGITCDALKSSGLVIPLNGQISNIYMGDVGRDSGSLQALRQASL